MIEKIFVPSSIESKKLFLVIGNLVTLQEEGDWYKPFPGPFLTEEIENKILTLLEPVLVKSEFFAKSNFQEFVASLHFCTDEKLQLSPGIIFRNERSTKSLYVNRRFLWRIHQENTAADWRKFLLAKIGELIFHTSVRYKLNTHAVRSELKALSEQYLVEFDLSPPRSAKQNQSEPVEVEIAIPASVDESIEFLDTLFELECEIDNSLVKAGCGYVEGSSFGSGTKDIFCVGENAEKIVKVVNRPLSKLKKSGKRVVLKIKSEGKLRELEI